MEWNLLEPMRLTLSRTPVMKGIEPEPAVSSNQTNSVTTLTRSQNIQPTTCPTCKMSWGQGGSEIVGVARQ